MGSISNHDRQEEFFAKDQRTSELVMFDGKAGIAETENTHYTLGKEYRL